MEKRVWLEEIINGMTHEQAAAKAQVERSTFTKVLNGYPVSIRTAKKIGKAFGFQWTLFYAQECEDTEHSTSA